jgi:hypothetical protein
VVVVAAHTVVSAAIIVMIAARQEVLAVPVVVAARQEPFAAPTRWDAVLWVQPVQEMDTANKEIA